MHELAPEILGFCRENGVRTSADVLADGWPELLDMIAPALEQVDWFLPNADQAMKLTGTDAAEAAAGGAPQRAAGGGPVPARRVARLRRVQAYVVPVWTHRPPLHALE